MTQSNDWHDRFQERLDSMQRRMEDHYENEMRLLAELRTRQVIQQQEIGSVQQEIQSLQEESRLELEQLREMRGNLLIQAENINALSQAVNSQITPAIVRLAGIVENLAEEFRQHRSDGHGT